MSFRVRSSHAFLNTASAHVEQPKKKTIDDLLRLDDNDDKKVSQPVKPAQPKINNTAQKSTNVSKGFTVRPNIIAQEDYY